MELKALGFRAQGLYGAEQTLQSDADPGTLYFRVLGFRV